MRYPTAHPANGTMTTIEYLKLRLRTWHRTNADRYKAYYTAQNEWVNHANPFLMLQYMEFWLQQPKFYTPQWRVKQAAGFATKRKLVNAAERIAAGKDGFTRAHRTRKAATAAKQAEWNNANRERKNARRRARAAALRLA